MTLVATPLASGLEALTPTDDTQVAIDAIVSAFVGYFAGASVNGVPATQAVLEGAPAGAMTSALAGLNTPGAGAGKIQSGVQAFWTALLGIEPTVWPLATGACVPSTLVPPSTLSALSASVQSSFDASVGAGDSLSEAASSLADAIHGHQAGGIVSVQPPTGAPVPTTIL